MTILDQQIAIATVCGWTHTKTVHNPDPSAYGRHPVHTADVAWDLPLPDYLNDLNAMHEAEKNLGEDEMAWFYYKRYILRLVGPDQHQLHATAAQRAEAFLRAFNLWKD